MATGRNTPIGDSMKAAGDLSGAKYHGVQLSANNTVNVTTAGGVCDGVLQNKPAAAGRGATVVQIGHSKIMCGGTVAYNETITMSASGWFTKATSGSVPCGRCILGANSGYPGEAVIVPNLLASTTSAQAGQI